MVKKHKKKRFNYNKNLKKAWKKQKAKKQAKVTDETLKAAWNTHKSIEYNYAELGLSSNPNKTLSIPRIKTLIQPEVMNLQKAIELENQNKFKTNKKETSVVQELEKRAKEAKDPEYNLNESDRFMCIYMMEKYGQEYHKMERDHKNFYQETGAQWKRKINLFKKMKNAFDKYLADKKAGVNFIENFE
jgi:hypothetical protein